MVSVGHEFPDFQMEACNKENEILTVGRVPDQWAVYYFYPKDFTFICPTEISGMDILVDNARVLGISGDNEWCKLAWKQSNELIRDINHTLAADSGLYLAEECGVVNEEEGVCYRATFIVDPSNIVQHVSVNALDTGRNAEEIQRTLQALKAGGLTGCAWQPEDDFVA